MAIDHSAYNIKLGDTQVERIGNDCNIKSFKFVGHHLDEFITWESHIKQTTAKLAMANYSIARAKNLLPLNARITLYNSLFRSHLEYGILSWGCAPMSKLNKVVSLQKKCI